MTKSKGSLTIKSKIEKLTTKSFEELWGAQGGRKFNILHLDYYLPKRICKPNFLKEVTKMLVHQGEQGEQEQSLAPAILLHNNIRQIRV
jgi:hypothetical protein